MHLQLIFYRKISFLVKTSLWMSDLQQLKTGSELERYRAAERLMSDTSPEASGALIQALSDEGVGESPGDYDAPPFLFPVAEAAAESLASRFEDYSQPILMQARGSDTAAFYVARMLRHQVRPEWRDCWNCAITRRGRLVHRPWHRCGRSFRDVGRNVCWCNCWKCWRTPKPA